MFFIEKKQQFFLNNPITKNKTKCHFPAPPIHDSEETIYSAEINATSYERMVIFIEKKPKNIPFEKPNNQKQKNEKRNKMSFSCTTNSQYFFGKMFLGE